jgi:hypothetical protein
MIGGIRTGLSLDDRMGVGLQGRSGRRGKGVSLEPHGHNRMRPAFVGDRMRAVLVKSRIRDRISVSGLLLIVTLVLAACQQKGSGGPGY